MAFHNSILFAGYKNNRYSETFDDLQGIDLFNIWELWDK